MKDKSFLGLKLSEFVEQSLANGLVPIFEFKDKDTIETGVAEPYVSPKDKTPVQVLQNEIKSFIRLQKMIESREGINEAVDESKLKELHNELSAKIIEFEKAINKLDA
jgi:hypothetical protein